MQLKFLLKGMRVKTLVAAVVPSVCSYSLFYSEQKTHTLFGYFLLCVLLALFIQIATNFYNDAIDFLKGADEKRLGPERITTQGRVEAKKVFIIGHIFLVLAFICGIPLVMKGGAVILILGIISLFFAYGYTGGPFPLAYLGLGELFVFLFFGLVATSGSYFIYSGHVSISSLIIGTQIGLLSSVLIAINNLRDRETDALVNKNTLATKMSKVSFLRLIDFFLFCPYLLILFFVFYSDLRYMFNIFSVPLAHKISQEIKEVQAGDELNLYLALSGKHLLIFSLLFSGISWWI